MAGDGWRRCAAIAARISVTFFPTGPSRQDCGIASTRPPWISKGRNNPSHSFSSGRDGLAEVVQDGFGRIVAGSSCDAASGMGSRAGDVEISDGRPVIADLGQRASPKPMVHPQVQMIPVPRGQPDLSFEIHRGYHFHLDKRVRKVGSEPSQHFQCAHSLRFLHLVPRASVVNGVRRIPRLHPNRIPAFCPETRVQNALCRHKHSRIVSRVLSGTPDMNPPESRQRGK